MRRRGPGPLFTLAWGLLALVSLSLVLVGGYILYAPEQATLFSRLTGLEFDALVDSSPDVADFITLLTRLLAITSMGFGILSLFVTWFGVRDRSPLSINVMWTLPLLTGGLALLMVFEGSNFVGLALAGLTALLALALVVARRQS